MVSAVRPPLYSVGLPAAEELEGGVAAHLELLSELRLHSSVHLGKLDWRVLLRQDPRSFRVLWSEGFTVSTPRSIKFYQDKLVAVDSFLEVVCSEDEHSLLLGDLRSHRREGGGGAEKRA